MEKEFIPYEQALALKELGFDEPCFWLYDGKILKTQIIPSSNSDFKYIDIVQAPLKQQAFRWFREKYKLCGLIEIGTQEFSYQVFNNKGNRQLGTEPISYNGTYEEAELECLKKLIEIVKDKK